MKAHQWVLFSLLLAAGSLTASSLRAGEAAWQPHREILQAARKRLDEVAAGQQASRFEVRVRRLDPRLRLRRCRHPLQTRLPEGARRRGATTVIVRCPGQDGWSIHVSGRIDIFDQVVVLARSLGRGEAITSDMLQVREQNTAQLRYGYFRQPREVVGRIAKRTLAAGTILTPGSVAAPLLVRRGERVTLVATRGAVSVRMQGEALRDGARGERIRVRNLRSKRIVEGEVVGRGVVKMTL